MKTGWRKLARAQNEILAQELGRVISGEARYRWIWSEDQEFFRSKRNFVVNDENKVVPDWEEIANPESPIVKLKPTYSRVKLVPQISRCFVVCRWIPNGSFDEHREKFADMVEWAGEGNYWPMEHPRGIVQLPPEICPQDDDTWDFIRLVRKDTQLGMEEILRRADLADKAEEARAFERNAALLDPHLPRFDHIPGKRGSGGISLRDPRLEKWEGGFGIPMPAKPTGEPDPAASIVIAKD